MTKTLSEQICEVCGIEPKYKCKNVPCLHFMADSGICILKDRFTKCNPEKCKDNYTPDTNHRNWKEAEAVYPDFENNNNNFVKLLELFHQNGFYIDDMRFLVMNISKECCLKKESFVTYFLKYLIKLLTDETVSEVFRNDLKQIIKQENWEY